MKSIKRLINEALDPKDHLHLIKDYLKKSHLHQIAAEVYDELGNDAEVDRHTRASLDHHKEAHAHHKEFYSSQSGNPIHNQGSDFAYLKRQVRKENMDKMQSRLS